MPYCFILGYGVIVTAEEFEDKFKFNSDETYGTTKIESYKYILQ